MDFSFTEQQTMLQESIERFVQSDYSFDDRQKNAGSDLGYDANNWNTFAELGWLGVPFSEADGGFGGGAVESTLMMEQFGHGLVIEPYLATVVLAGGVIKHAGSEAQKAKLLPGIIDGSTQAALAYAEPQARFNLADVTTTATPEGDGFVLNGYKAVVLNGPAAQLLIVSARTSGDQRDSDGITLFAVDAKAAGISRRDYPTVDAFRASEITLEGVKVDADAVMGEVGKGYAALEQAIDEGILAVGS
jgi:alkylation response protein AidB-like acyl-CoA dehydrogenase